VTDNQDNNTSPARAVDDDGDDGPVLEWTTHPLKRKPWTAVGVTLFILIVSFVVLVATDSQWFGFIALVVLFASVAKFYMPTKFRLTQKNVTIKSTTQTITKPWSMFRSSYPDKNGILLSPFAEPSRLENFRGLYLIFAENRDDVTAFVRTRIESTHGSSEEEKA
jgi:hypothetical protein